MSTSASLYGVGVGTASTATLGLSPIVTVRAPASTDIRGPGGPLKIGQIWVNTVANASYILTSFSSAAGQTTANWSLQGSVAGVLDTLSGDVGGTITPTAGNIVLAGTGGEIVTTGAGSTITFSIDDPFNIPGDVIIPGTLTVAGAVLLATTGASVNTLGNATGATSVGITSGTGGIALASTGAGDITLASSDTLLLDSAGVLEINSSAGVIGIGNDAVAQNINIGTGAAARTLTLGNVSSTTGIVLNSGTGGVAVNTTGTGDVVVTSADTVLIDSAGVLELNSSAGVISVGNDAVSQNINVGTAGTRAIAIGNSTATTSVAINGGTGSSVNIGTNAIAHTVTIGNITTSSAVTVNTGTGGFNVNTTSTGDIVLASADTVLIDGAGVVEINSSAGVISVGNDAVNQNINVGTAGTRTLAIGSATATETVLGTFNLNTTGSLVTSINTGGTGALNLGNATGNTAVTGSLTATTTLTATLGAITATNGNLVLGTAGNKIMSTSVGTTTTAGANSFGTVTLTGGTATVATTAITTNSIVFLTRQTIGATGAAALGLLSRGTITNGVSFVIDSLLTADATALATTDVSNVGWFIVN